MQQIGMKYCYSYEEHNKRSLFFRKRWLGIGLYARGKHKAEYAKMQVFFLTQSKTSALHHGFHLA